MWQDRMDITNHSAMNMPSCLLQPPCSSGTPLLEDFDKWQCQHPYWWQHINKHLLKAVVFPSSSSNTWLADGKNGELSANSSQAEAILLTWHGSIELHRTIGQLVQNTTCHRFLRETPTTYAAYCILLLFSRACQNAWKFKHQI